MVLFRLPVLAVLAAAVLCLHVCEAAPVVKLPSPEAAAAAAEADNNTLARRGYVDRAAAGMLDVATSARQSVGPALGKAATWSAQQLSKATGWIGKKATEMSAKFPSKEVTEGAAARAATWSTEKLSGATGWIGEKFTEMSAKLLPKKVTEGAIVGAGTSKTAAKVADEAAPALIPGGSVAVSGGSQAATVVDATEAAIKAQQSKIADLMMDTEFANQRQILRSNLAAAKLKLDQALKSGFDVDTARKLGLDVDVALAEKKAAEEAIAAFRNPIPAQLEAENAILRKLRETQRQAGQAA